MSSIDAISGANTTEYTGTPGAPGNEAGSGIDFSSVLAEAMKEEMTRVSITGGANTSGVPGGFMPMQMQTSGIEQAILTAASTGQATDAQIALFMLCMMMQTSQDGDFSMMMQMMASMLTQIQDDAGSLRNTVMSSDYDPYILDTLDWNVFGMSMPEGFTAGRATLPVEFWRPTTPVITSSAGERNPELYRSVINQFRVETAERYKPFRDGATYCNIFMWDVTSAMGAEIPHYTDPQTGEPRYYPDIKNAASMTARAIDEWLGAYGTAYGWREVNAETAQRYANEGKPAVTTAGTLDHVQVVCPSKDGEYDPIRGVAIAQAGRIVTNYTHISSIYSSSAMQNIRYWVHD